MGYFEKDSNIFKILADAVSEGIIIVNTSQEIVATNRSADEMFGYETNELLGENLQVLIPQKYKNAHKKYVKFFLETTGRRTMGDGRDLYGLRKNGECFPLEVGLNPFQIFGNNYIMALVVDITARRKIEMDLMHWANIFNESLNEIYIYNPENFRFIDVNKGALNNIGYSLSEMRELNVLDITPEISREQLDSFIAPLKKKADKKTTFNTVHLRKDGSTYPVEVHLQYSSTAQMDTFVAIVLDITERINYTNKLEKKVKERTYQLREALNKEKELNQLKTKFLSLVSHEFRTPLSTILTSSVLIEKYQKETYDEKIIKHVNTIQDKVKYLNNILNEFLSIEKLDKGEIKYTISRVPLSKVINEVVYDANMNLKEGQQINYPENADSTIVDTDVKVLNLVLTNLLSNAIKYSSENTTIDIKISQAKKWIVIKVVDEGMGIPKEEQRFIFDRYYRATNAISNHGTGIGLNIVKAQLENLGGTISFISEENKGSVFTVKLPALEESEKKN